MVLRVMCRIINPDHRLINEVEKVERLKKAWKLRIKTDNILKAASMRGTKMLRPQFPEHLQMELSKYIRRVRV